MTGPRRLRGRLDDDRHGRAERSTYEPVGTHTELEELSVGRVTARGSTRPGLQATAAAVGLVVLLALGFGAFGGRQPPNDGAGSSPTAVPPSAPLLAAGQTPAVTPSTQCAAPPAAPPEVLLAFEDRAVPAVVRVLEQPRGVPASAAPADTPLPGEARRTRVPAEVAASIWLTGATCANAWTIRVGSDQIEAVGNAGLDPAYASQNRFEVFLAPYGGTVTDLQADLVFPAMVVRASWPLIVDPYPVPEAFLATEGGERWSATEGCDLQVSTQVRSFGIRPGCQGSLPRPDPRPTPNVQPSGGLTFEIEDYQFPSAFISCGTVLGVDYFADPTAGCIEGEYVPEPSDGAGTIRVTAPAADGVWTIAIGTCASPASGAGDAICGTWYADVEVGPPSGFGFPVVP